MSTSGHAQQCLGRLAEIVRWSERLRAEPEGSGIPA